MKNLITIDEFILLKQQDFPYAKGELSSLLGSIVLASKIVNNKISRAGIDADVLGDVGVENVQGEKQKKLDLLANEIFKNALESRDQVCGIASEEEEIEVAFTEELNRNGKYVLLMDPLDGSSNVDVNVSVGTIFSIYRRISPVGEHATKEDFLQPGSKQVAAGYILYGSSTMLVYTTGNGTHAFTLDPALGTYYLVKESMQIPPQGNYYSVNEGHYQKFPQAVKDYIKFCQEPNAEENRPYTSRYIGSLIADAHRNMIKGGIYMYPSSHEYPLGKLRLLYEGNPMAFLIEQAGGIATDGNRRLLEIEPTELHQRTPCYLGSSLMIEDLLHFFEKSKSE